MLIINHFRNYGVEDELEELRRRNFADTTIRSYLHGVEHSSRFFRRRPDQLGQEDIRKYQAALITKASRQNKLTYLFQRRHECVVPFTVKIGSFQIQRSELRVADLCSSGVASLVQFGADFQTRFGSGVCD